MTRCKISIGILCGLILLCVCSLTLMQKQCEKLLFLTDEIISAVESGNTPEALVYFDQLEQNWNRYHEINGIFVNGTELNDLREILSGLRPLILQQHPEALSELQKMHSFILSLYEEELPELWHIL